MGSHLMDWIHGSRTGPVPDSMAFRLHYRTTVAIFLTLGVVLGFLQAFGDPITCKGGGRSVVSDAELLTSYCWNAGIDLFKSSSPSHNDVAHPGVSNSPPKDSSKSFAYLKTLPLLFILQSLLFYVTHYFWKIMEGGMLERLTRDLAQATSTPKLPSLEKRFGTLKMYAFIFFILELLNVLNAFSNFVYIDRLMDHQFWFYGWHVSQHLVGTTGSESDPRRSIFPRVVGCTMTQYGSSGSIIKFDSVCILQWSFLLEPVLLFLWGWLIVLMIVSILSFVYRSILFCCSPLRFRLLRTSAVGPLLTDHGLVSISSASVGSWFLILSLSEHVVPSKLAQLLNENQEDQDNDSVLDSIVSQGKH